MVGRGRCSGTEGGVVGGRERCVGEFEHGEVEERGEGH